MEAPAASVTALLAARRDPAVRPAGLPAPPASEAEAYAIQAAIMARLGPIGGWKVGFTPATGVFTCAPLPAASLRPGPAAIGPDCTDRGVEAEIALRLGRDLPARTAPYAAGEILAAIATAHPANEVLQSRYADVTRVDPLSNLADSLSHYGLIYGPAITRWRELDLSRETVSVLVDGRVIRTATANPAGDMIPLLVWLADHGARWAGGLRAGQVVTTGSWTGKEFVPAGAEVTIRFTRCGEVAVRFA